MLHETSIQGNTESGAIGSTGLAGKRGQEMQRPEEQTPSCGDRLRMVSTPGSTPWLRLECLQRQGVPLARSRAGRPFGIVDGNLDRHGRGHDSGNHPRVGKPKRQGPKSR